MKFLIDEDVPVRLLRVLNSVGHDAIRVAPSSPDREIALRAKQEGRVLITLDRDFTNTRAYPPKEFNIVRIQIHPPTKDTVTQAFERLLRVYPEGISGLILLRRDDHFQMF